MNDSKAILNCWVLYKHEVSNFYAIKDYQPRRLSSLNHLTTAIAPNQIHCHATSTQTLILWIRNYKS